MICIYSIYVSFSLKQNMQHNLSVELLPTIFSQFSNQEHMFFPRSFLPFRRVKNLPQIKFIGIDCQKRRSCTLSGDGSFWVNHQNWLVMGTGVLHNHVGLYLCQVGYIEFAWFSTVTVTSSIIGWMTESLSLLLILILRQLATCQWLICWVLKHLPQVFCCSRIGHQKPTMKVISASWNSFFVCFTIGMVINVSGWPFHFS